MKSSSRILIGYAVALAVIAILTFFTYRNFKTVTNSSVGYKNTLGILKNIEFVYSDVLLMENESKACIIGGDEVAKKKYAATKQQTITDLDSLKKYSAFDENVRGLTDTLNRIITSEINLIDKVFAANKKNGNAKAHIAINTLNSSPFLNLIQQHVASIESVGRIHLHKFSDEANSRERKTLIVFVFLSFSVFIFLGIVFYKILKTNNARVEAERQLKKLNEGLEFLVEKKSAELNVVFERITDAVIALDKNWNYTYVNDKAGELHGLAPKDLIGKNIWEEFPYAVNEPLYGLLHNTMEKQTPISKQVYYSTSNKWYDYFIYPSPDGVSVYYHDVTDKKITERELQKSELNHRILLEQASDAIFMADKNFRVINANTSAIDLLGYDHDELLTLSINDLFYEDELNAKPLRFDELKQGLNVLMERNMKRKNGTTVPVEINSKMLPDGRFQGIVRNISERKNIEQKKLIAEQKYRLLFERNLSGIYRTEFGGKILDCNDACAKIFGYDSAAEFLSHTAQDLYYNEQDRIDFLKVLKEKKSIFNYEVKMKRKNGTPVYLIENTMLFESAENPDGILEGIVIDLTEKKKAEKELQKSEDKFKMLIENSHDGISLLNQFGEIIYISPAGERITGFKLDELQGKKIFEFFHPEGSDEAKEFFQKLNDNPGVTLNDNGTRLMHKNGNYILVEANVTNLLHNENVKAIITNFRDITQRLQTEEALEKSEEKFRMLIENSHQAICLLNEKREITYLSPAGERIIGYKTAEIIGKNLQEFFHPERPQRAIEFFKKIIETPGKTFYNTNRLKKKNGDYMVADVSVTNMLHDKNVNAIITNFRDITEKVRTEEALEKSKLNYQLLIEQAPDGVFISNEADFILEVNSKGCEMLGYELTELQKLKITDLIDPENLKDNPAKPNDYIGGKTVIMERVLFKKDATKIEVEISGRMLEDGTYQAFVRDISERKKIERELVKSELNYKTLIEQAPDGIFISRTDFGIDSVNASGCTMLGYELSELQKMKFTDFISKENMKNDPLRIDDLMAGKTVITERIVIRKDGTLLTVEVCTKLLSDGKFQAFARDITERKRIEKEFQKSEASFRTLIEQAPDGVFISNTEHVMQDVNERGCKMLGYELAEFQKMKFYELIATENLESMPINFEGLSSGKTVMSERILVRKDGTKIPVEISAKVLSDGRFQSFIRDISERKRIESELQKSELHYKLLIEQAPDGVFISGTDFFVGDANSIGCKMLGYELSELQKMKMTDFISAENLKANPFDWEKYKNGNTVISERILVRKDGTEVPVEISAKFLADGKLQAFVRDISERKKIKEELRDMNTRLRSLTSHIQNAIEEERKHIAREIHDELGQLLTGLKIDLSWMNKRQGLSEELTLKTEEMLLLTDRTIQSVRKIATELRPGILDDLGLNEAIIWQANEFQNKTGIECNVHGEILRTDYSPEQNITAFRIMQESLTNVMRHANANHVMISLNEKENFLTLVIADDGIGIANMHNFEQKSLGILGMKERVNIIGGSLNIFSEPNHGTTVTVEIPLIPKK